MGRLTVDSNHFLNVHKTQHGSISLEHLLITAGALAVCAVGLKICMTTLSLYLEGFIDAPYGQERGLQEP